MSNQNWSEGTNMETNTDVNCHRGVWVFMEECSGALQRVSLELLGAGRKLADELETELSAIMIGHSMGSLPDELLGFGADNILVAEHPLLGECNTDYYADIIVAMIETGQPAIFLVGATPVGRDVTPRIAARMRTGCTADCTNLEIDKEQSLLVSTRPAFGGNVMATIICPLHRPQIATVRPGVMAMPLKDRRENGKIMHIDVDETMFRHRIKIIESVDIENTCTALEESKKIISVGMGACDEEILGRVNTLARLVGAQVGCSRKAVETGVISHDYQVGQTGKTVRPELYIACGISGAVQHTAGMADSKVVVAINKDPEAEIFNFADYGIVGDAREIVDALIAELSQQ